MNPSIALIGPGRVGSAVAKKLSVAGFQLTTVISRHQQRAVEACRFIGCPTHLATDQIASARSADIFLLAVPDDQIQSIAQHIWSRCDPKNIPTLIHFSGLHPAAIMQDSNTLTTLLSLHPLLPFASREKGYEALDQCPWAVESETSQGLQLGTELATAMGGIPFIVATEKKALYHAAACLSSNYFVTLISIARKLLTLCEIEKEQVIPLLLPLMRATFTNIEEFGVENGLSGPIIRGDVGTVSKHLQTLDSEAPEFVEIYRHLGLHTATIGEQSQRLSVKQAARMKETLIVETNKRK